MKKRRVLTEPQIKSKSLILNIICIVLTALFTIILACQFTLRAAVKQNSIDDAIKNIDYSKLTVQVSDEKMPFDKYINDYYILDESVTDEDINALLQKSTASEFIAGKYDELRQYILGGSYKLPTITAEEIANLLDENKDLIYSESPIKFLSDDHAELISSLEGPLKSFNTSISESKMISVAKFACSLAMIILSIVILCVILFAWAVNYSRLQNKNYPAIRNFGITMLAASAVTSVFMLIYSSNPKSITSFTQAVDLSDFGAKVFSKGALVSVVLGLVGIAVLAAGIFTSIHHKKTYIEESPDVEYNYGKENKNDGSVFSVLGQEDTEIETVYASDNNVEINPDDYYKEDDYREDVSETPSEPVSEIDELISKIDDKKVPDENVDKTVSDESFEVVPPENAVADETENEIKNNIADKVNEIKQQKQNVSGKHEAAHQTQTQPEPPEKEIVMPEITANAAIPVNGRVCPNCGKTNLSRNLFCSECGALLK